MKTTAWLVAAAGLPALLVGGGCGAREHLGRSYGISVRAALHAQVIHPDAGDEKKPTAGLDPQEAAIIADTYFRSLAPTQAAPRKAPILVVEEPEEPKLPLPMGGTGR